MRKMEWNGKTVNAEPVDFEATAPERFTYYKAADGTLIKVKVVITDISRVVGEYHPGTGEPVYITSQMVLVTTEAKQERLMQHADKSEGIKH